MIEPIGGNDIINDEEENEIVSVVSETEETGRMSPLKRGENIRTLRSS